MLALEISARVTFNTSAKGPEDGGGCYWQRGPRKEKGQGYSGVGKAEETEGK